MPTPSIPSSEIKQQKPYTLNLQPNHAVLTFIRKGLPPTDREVKLRQVSDQDLKETTPEGDGDEEAVRVQ